MPKQIVVVVFFCGFLAAQTKRPVEGNVITSERDPKVRIPVAEIGALRRRSLGPKEIKYQTEIHHSQIPKVKLHKASSTTF